MELESDNSIKKSAEDYRLLGKFDILTVDVEGTTVKKLVKKGTQLRYVCKEDLFEIINRARSNNKFLTTLPCVNPALAALPTKPRLELNPDWVSKWI
ncbi:hypothetical protein Ddc_17065 [Ditylenchus destructor]|nr:hypothetical protein Ddc_17065 [Ditylenchus destructor]